jgi:hypothetical protein
MAACLGRDGHRRTKSPFEEASMPKLLLDAAGRRRSPATLPGFHAGCPATQ